MAEIVSSRAKLRPGLPAEHSVQPEEVVGPICEMTVEVATARISA